MTIKGQIRQGDVLLTPIDKLPENLKEKDNILAYGEVTGHKHQLVGTQVQVFADDRRNQFAEVKEKSILRHEEHGWVDVVEGIKSVRIQREEDIIEGIKQVLD
jgi:hypothetical protein